MLARQASTRIVSHKARNSPVSIGRFQNFSAYQAMARPPRLSRPATSAVEAESER
ncbi:MAG: hypothetical protein WDO13_03195 [Verrucomicrobiota bacterium]